MVNLLTLSPVVLFLTSVAASSSLSVPLKTSKRSTRTPQGIAAELQQGRQVLVTKYGGTIESRKREVGVEVLGNIAADTSFVGTIDVGGSSFSVIVDTGSADLVLATAPCETCESDTVLYTPSSSSVDLGTDFSITYGAGSASGTLRSDSVSIAGFTVASQTFAACTTFTGLLSTLESGLLGLGWQALSNSGAMPVVQALYEAGSLTNPLFAFQLASWSADSDANPDTDSVFGGYLTIGDTNSTLYTGDIAYIPLVDDGSYWSIKLDDVRVNGVSVGVSSDGVIVDTGSTLVSMPAASVSSVYAAISGDSYSADSLMVYPCASNPVVSFSFNGVWYDIPADAFAYGTANSEGTECYGSVYDYSGGSSDFFIIGAAFLKNYYSVFSFDPPAVGLAALASSDRSATPSSASSSIPSSTSASPSSIASSTDTSSASSLSSNSSSLTDTASSTLPSSSAPSASAASSTPLSSSSSFTQITRATSDILLPTFANGGSSSTTPSAAAATATPTGAAGRLASASVLALLVAACETYITLL